MVPTREEVSLEVIANVMVAKSLLVWPIQNSVLGIVAPKVFVSLFIQNMREN